MKRGDPRKRRRWRAPGNKIVQKVWHANRYWDERHSEGIGGKGRTQTKAFIEMLKKSFQWEPSSFLTTFLDRVNMEEFCWIWDHVICGQIKKQSQERQWKWQKCEVGRSLKTSSPTSFLWQHQAHPDSLRRLLPSHQPGKAAGAKV